VADVAWPPVSRIPIPRLLAKGIGKVCVEELTDLNS
jgi:hypothetical protein